MNVNVLILGKSGAGKSTLLNYLWGEKIAEAGIGKPVTPKETKDSVGLYESPPVSLNGHSLTVFDSWGMEADKAEEWLRTLMPEMKKRELSPSVEDWFHAVIYCVGASGARLEPFETEVARQLQRAGHTVVFALTKAGRASQTELAALQRTIREDCPDNGGIVEVESRNVVLRNGETTNARGKEELTDALTKNLAKKLKYKLAVLYPETYNRHCASWKAATLDRYDREAGFFTPTAVTMSKVGPFAQARLESLFSQMNTWLNKAISDLESFQEAFDETIGVIHRENVPVMKAQNAKDKIVWDTAEYATLTLVSLIPGLNIAYMFVATDMHKDRLSEKLDGIISKIRVEAETYIRGRLL
ncbi:GTPase [Paraburkholderia sp. C35]|uniref:GTPase n=1 Tax=Paraburkholderia sp. C35 TaxID=2126993 RepID=UPI000D68C6BD|nr:GTPase [Paraburkholderia sp. C35]